MNASYYQGKHMKKILYTFLLFNSMAILASPYIDKETLKIDNQREIAITKMFKDCKKTENYRICEKEEWKKLDTQYLSRGSREYSQKYYSQLSKAQADKVIQHLAKIAPQTRYTDNPDLGEITREQIEREGHWIQSNIFNRSTSLQEPLMLSTGKVLPFYRLKVK